MSRTRTRVAAMTVAAVTTVSLAGCAGWGGGGTSGDPNAVTVLMVNNPQMMDLQKLTAASFTAKTGIKVNFPALPENDVRDKISQEFSSQAGQYDVASLSNFEIPIYAKAKWGRPDERLHRQRPGLRPGRHPQADADLALGRRHGLRPAVLGVEEDRNRIER